MNIGVIRHLVILFLCMVMAIVMGGLVASGEYELLLLLAYGGFSLFILAVPGYIPLFAFGLLNPFILPIPFVRGMPFLLIIMGVCVVKFFFHSAIKRHRLATGPSCFTMGFGLFLGWVVFRFALKPTLPNFSGFGDNVTGFRSYLSFGLCGMLVLFLPRIVTTRAEAMRMLRWCLGISIVFIVFLVPLVFTKSMNVASWLSMFGLFVTFFDNGWLRFVSLTSFGLIVLMLAFLPHLLPYKFRTRLLLGLLGFGAVLVGGTRSGFVMALVQIFVMLSLQKRFFLLGWFAAGSAGLLLLFNVVGENLSSSSSIGFFRILSIASRRVAESTDAADTTEWRLVRWRRAMMEIQQNPWVGKGYGGLENAWVFANSSQYEDAMVGVDMATGGIHNGFLSCAYSLGIPAVVLFLGMYLVHVWKNARAALDFWEREPLQAEFFIFITANLVSFLPAIYIGTDLNAPVIWFTLAMGELWRRMETVKMASAPADLSPVAG
jgi:O-antigen ligase